MLGWYKNLSLAMKLAVASLVATVVLMASLVLFLTKYVSSELEAKALHDMEQQTKLVINQLKSFDDSLRSAVGRICGILMSRFDGKASLDSAAQIQAGNVSLPSLRIGGVLMNGNSNELDKLAQVTGGVNSVLVRNGDDFFRIATSLKNEKGERAVGIPLGNAHPARTKLLAGSEYVGRAKSAMGAELMVKFVPIKDDSGRVVGAYGVSLDFSKSLTDLKKEILSVKIGETGYIYAMDYTQGDKYGNFTIHPSKEGKNGLGVKDSSGREFLREVVEKKSGAIVYPWMNDGDKAPRDKIAAYQEFPEWQWVVVGSSYTEEMTREAGAIRNALLVATIIIVAVLSFIIISLSRNQITTPLSSLIRQMDEIGRGNLNNHIQVTSNDEIGQLQTTMQQMQHSLRSLVTEIKTVVASAEQGDFSKSLNVQGKEGFGLEVGQSLNSLVRISEEGLNSIASVAGALAAGDLSKTIAKEFPGTFGSTIQGMNSTVTVLNTVINEVREVVNAASQGDFSHKMDTTTKHGYAKTLAELLNRLSTNADEALSDISRVALSLSSGDLTQKIDKQYPGLFGQTAQGINTTVSNLRELVGSVVESVDAINTAAGEISAGNHDLSGRTEEQASSLEETAASMEELTSMVRQNTENARQANELAQGSSKIADAGGVVVKASVQTMEDIATSSRKISDIISVIDGIAFQTNILALNAAVEAARAGEQGRGFAVVASEVRNLALRAAGAAKEIKDLITESVDKVERGTQQAEEAGKTMEEIVASISRVSHIIADISNASGEQTSGIEQVNVAIVQMDQATQQNAALVEQAAAAAESMEEQARQLHRLVGSFKL